MRISRVAVLATIALAFALPSAAHADPTPTPSPTIDPYRAAMNQFKLDRDAYINQIRARSQAIKLINKNFNLAIEKANLDFQVARPQAKTPAQRSQLAYNLAMAKSAATAAHDSAILALGPEPVAPAEPTITPTAKMGPMKSGKSKK